MASASSSTPPTILASTMMHDFSLSMSEYRGEMNENMGRLNDKINKLEGIIVNLSEKIPEFVTEINRKLADVRSTSRVAAYEKEEDRDDDQDIVVEAGS